MMKSSELIDKLQGLIDKYGDLDVHVLAEEYDGWRDGKPNAKDILNIGNLILLCLKDQKEEE